MKKNYLNQLVLGDALDILSTIDEGSVDLVCADPPYNLGKDYGTTFDQKEWCEYEKFTTSWLSECKRILKSDGSIYIFMGVRYIARLYSLLEEIGFLFNGWISWHYTQGMGRKKGFSPRHEDILYFTRSPSFKFNLDDIRVPQKYYRERNNMQGANPGDVWSFSHVHYSNPEREAHPTQKPEGVIERIILASSNEGDTILDPFVGSGTTCRVAKILNRNFIGIDIHPEYIDISTRRLAKPFDGFDSVDPRVSRRPKDLPEDRKRKHSNGADSQTQPKLF